MASYKNKLGDLEMEVLDHLWRNNEGTVRSVHQSVGKARRVSSNTIQSTLERLYRKSLLQREKSGHAYEYRPALTRAELMSRYIGDVIETFADGRNDHVLTAFVDWLDRVDNDTLNELETLLEARRSEKASTDQ